MWQAHSRIHPGRVHPSLAPLSTLTSRAQKTCLWFSTCIYIYIHLHLGWPDLQITGDQLFYHGPLPRECPCRVAHSSTTGTSPGLFFSSKVYGTFIHFWFLGADFHHFTRRLQSSLPKGSGCVVRLHERFVLAAVFFSLSSSGCSRLQSAASPCVQFRDFFYSVESRSVALQPKNEKAPRGTVGDGTVEWSTYCYVQTIGSQVHWLLIGVTSPFCLYRVVF